MSLNVVVWLQLAFGLAMVLPIEKDIRFGLLCTACVPGGGLGHIAVVIGDADIPLSLTMNLISVVAMLGELFTSIRLARCGGQRHCRPRYFTRPRPQRHQCRFSGQVSSDDALASSWLQYIPCVLALQPRGASCLSPVATCCHHNDKSGINSTGIPTQSTPTSLASTAPASPPSLP